MKAFSDLYTRLDQTTKTNDKVNAMVQYFNEADPADSVWAVALLTGRRPKRPVPTAELKRWATELAVIPAWLFDECYNVAGDLGETVSLLVPATPTGSDKPLRLVMQEIMNLAKEELPEKKSWLLGYWGALGRQELFVFNKLMSGSFRVGVSAQLVFRSLARARDMDEKVVAHKLMGNWLPLNSTLDQLLDASTDHSYSQPYPFYLAYQLDLPFSELGSVEEWQIERKYDGIRGQIVVRNGETHIWSRGEELMNERFVEFASLSGLLPNGTVLDGEVLPYRDGQILNFNALQTRIGRKVLSKKILQEVPLCMMCYDLLEHNGEDIRELPLRTRRKLLEDLLQQHPTPQLQLSPLLPANSWDELPGLRNKAREVGCEGVMLKHKDSRYETGRRRGKWWKWKVDPFTVDAVMVYAQAGHGRRANLYTDYTFAVWDQGELVPFAKAYSGLTDKEIVEVDNWVKRHTLEKFGPVRRVQPELVFEIAFEGINASPRHKSGIALRFPRILRWRRDKKPEEINTKTDLLQLLQSL